jgi:arylsulfatase A
MSNILTNYRSFLKAFSVVLLAFPYCAYGLTHNRRTKPNIVFILADDLGRYQLSSYGSRFYETPNIDRLVKEGVRFTNAYAAAPICSPTRASIMTGKYPARLHLTDFIPGGNPKDKKLITPDWQKHLPLKEVTIAESLKNAGYVTGHFGKWHLNVDKKYKPGRPGDPGSQGFDDVLTTHKPGAGPKSMYDEDWHHVREITERSIAFIENNKDKPFFCYVTHNSIHSPEIEKKALVEKYATKPEAKTNKRNNPKQAAMLETLDKSVGTILMTLEKLGLEKNTIVFFYSDNGQLGPKNGKPFRGSKGDLYEGGIRMPLIIKWPGVITPGSECGEVVISNDFFPTITAIAGGSSTAKDVDGINFLPLLKDSGAKLTREAVYWHFPHYHSLGLGPQGAVRMGRYKLIEWFERSAYDQANAFELYDLIKDPGEQRNLADTMPEVTAKLKEKLNAWKKRIGAQLMTKRKSQKVEPQR